MEYKFTIAIPVFNGIKSIENSIKSAISQCFDSEYEILVVDNFSSDGTYEYIKKYDGQIRIERNTSTVSMYDNHNICLKNAKGDYVLFCHSDDVLTENSLAILEKHITLHDFPSKLVIWGRSMFRDFGDNYQSNGGEINKILSGMNSVKPFLHRGLTPSGTCYSRKSFLNLGGFIKCNHPLAPSDMTTMLMLALNDYEFKMIDELLFERKFASTMIVGTKLNDSIEAMVDSVSELKSVITLGDFKKLIDTNLVPKQQPFNFYYSCVKNNIFKKRIKKMLYRKCVKRPVLLRRKIVWRILLGI